MLSVETICRLGITPTHPRDYCYSAVGELFLGVAGYQIALDLSLGLHDILDSALSFDPSA
jgi:hypothetical protein